MKNYIINGTHERYFKLKEDFEEIEYDKKHELMRIKCEIDKIPSKKWERAKKKVNDYLLWLYILYTTYYHILHKYYYYQSIPILYV